MNGGSKATVHRTVFGFVALDKRRTILEKLRCYHGLLWVSRLQNSCCQHVGEGIYGLFLFHCANYVVLSV